MSDNDDWFNKYFDQLKQRKQQTTNNTSNNGYQDVNMSRYVDHMVTKPGNQSAVPTCTLKPGAVFYRPLATNGFYPKFPIVRTGGTVPANGTVFEYKGERRCVLADNQKSIDFSKIDETSNSLITLVEVKAPFVGSVLVAASSIAEISGQGGSSKGILFG